jgi:type IV pilus assembly protein PilN
LIKINLLSAKRAKKKGAPINETALQIAVGVALTVIALGATAYRWQALESEVTEQTQIKAQKSKELEELKKQVIAVENFEKNKKLLEDKNRVIEQLRKNQSGPVRLLDVVSQGLEPVKVWLIGMEESGADVNLSGRALSNDDIVEFTRNVQNANYFSSVLLEESRQALEDGVQVYQFKMKLRRKL